MKIQGSNNWAGQINYKNKQTASDDSFCRLLKERNEKALSDESNVLKPSYGARPERIEYSKKLKLSNVNTDKLSGFKELAKDAFSDTGAEILQEIEALCNDETGEGIDVKVLGELLELCKSTRL